MLERYQRFDAARMLAELPAAKKTLANLKAQLEAMDGLSGMDYDKVGRTNSKEGLDQVVIRRANLKAKIDDYQKDIDLIDGVLNAMTDEERLIVKEFFWMNQSKLTAVMRLADELHMDRATIYRRRDMILQDVTRALLG